MTADDQHKQPSLEGVSAAEDVIRALLAVVVSPLQREMLLAVRELNSLKGEQIALEKRRLHAYEDRTRLLREDVLPKLIPVTVSALGVIVAWLAYSVGVPVP